MEIHLAANPAQNKILRTTCAPFDFARHDAKEIKAMVIEMRKKMHEWRGIGLAATQIGRTESFFVAQPPNGKFFAIFNPRITKTEGRPILMEEGCLSIPNSYGEVPRYEKLVLEGFDQKGKPIKIKAWGVLAHIFQHEYDHLQGTLYIDKVKSLRKLPASDEPKMNDNGGE